MSPAEFNTAYADSPLKLITSTKERLNYNIYWSGIYVGKAEMLAVKNHDKVTINLKVDSAPVISFFYKVDDHAQSVVINSQPAHFRLKQREGRHRGDKETFFDYSTGKIEHFNYLKNTRNVHNVSDVIYWDLISGFYTVRHQQLTVGKPHILKIFDNNKLFEAEVNILRRESIELRNGREIKAIAIQPKLDTEALFKRKGDMVIWLSDDSNRLPVRVETSVPIGSVTAELSSYSIE
ncbi:MAG: DUF3108 domain-containing protein [Dissulfurispiraceae bacterium]|jgi:hypothetical protein|nr:DUF3108 domain-containing protein [Dissulfurispiraceae bacterium]